MHTNRLLLVIILLLSTLAGACADAAPSPASTTAAPQTLTVFAAASLTDAFSEIGRNFEAANPDVTVRFNFAGSQSLRTQIEQGAQADVFASANTREMDALVKGAYVPDGSVQVFASNYLVVVLPSSNPAGLQSLADLGKEGVKVVMAAQEVPVGSYTLQVLENLEAGLGGGYKDRVLANVVSYENDVKQALAKVQLGEADAGVVYLSDSLAARDVIKIEIPLENNVVANYPIAALRQSSNPALAQAFINYVISTEGQNILAKWGFAIVQ